MRIWLLIIAVLYGGTSLAAGQERFALVVGANIGEPGDEPLRFAEKDASRMAELLTRFASVSEENLLLLKGRSAARVEAAFVALSERIKRAESAGKETLLFVYYSGHADVTAMHLGTTRLDFTRLTSLVDAAGATLKVLVVDACRSGELTRVKGARPVQPFKIVSAERLKSEGNAIITSSAAGEDAQESDRLGGGIFSHHFMMGLRGAADRTGDRTVSLSEAYRYAYDQTLRTTSRARFLQHPTYAFKMKGREDLVLTRLTDDSGLGRLKLNGSGTWLMLNQRMPSTGVIEVTTNRKGEVVMPPGRYTLRLRTARAVFEGAATVRSGQTQQVRRSQLSVVPFGRTVRKGYRENQSAVLGVILGGVATGAVTEGVGPNFGAVLGLRADFKPLSLELRARGSLASADNLDLELQQRALGIDLTVLKLYDPGFLSLGFGFRTAVDWLEQRFDTQGQAPQRSSVVGRAAPVLRIEKAIGANTSIVASGFVDGALINRPEGRQLVALPGGELGLTVVFQ